MPYKLTPKLDELQNRIDADDDLRVAFRAAVKVLRVPVLEYVDIFDPANKALVDLWINGNPAKGSDALSSQQIQQEIAVSVTLEHRYNLLRDIRENTRRVSEAAFKPKVAKFLSMYLE